MTPVPAPFSEAVMGLLLYLCISWTKAGSRGDAGVCRHICAVPSACCSSGCLIERVVNKATLRSLRRGFQISNFTVPEIRQPLYIVRER